MTSLKGTLGTRRRDKAGNRRLRRDGGASASEILAFSTRVDAGHLGDDLETAVFRLFERQVHHDEEHTIDQEIPSTPPGEGH